VRQLKTNEWIAVSVALIVILLFFVIRFPFVDRLLGIASQDVGKNTSDSLSISSQDLEIQDLVVGTGTVAQIGSKLVVNYIGMFENGNVFDSSGSRNQPFEFTLGVDAVIEGWQRGLLGMKAGSVRRLIVPPHLGYGPNDYGPIPGNSTLIFDVELLEVK